MMICCFKYPRLLTLSNALTQVSLQEAPGPALIRATLMRKDYKETGQSCLNFHKTASV